MAASKVIPDRGVVLAWSPLAANGGVLATGVKEGGGGGFEEYGGDLTLHGVDMGSPSLQCPTLGRCVRARRSRRLPFLLPHALSPPCAALGRARARARARYP
jgi:hypothetical protein